MPTTQPNLGPGYTGADFADELRDYFACGVLVVDAGGTLAALTPEAVRLLGLPAGNDAHCSAKDLPSPLQSLVRDVRTSGRKVTDQRVVLSAPAGVPVTARVTAMPAGSGNSSAVVLVVKNVAAAERLDQNLRRLDRLATFGTLSASLAHEIKNALVPVRTFVDLLLERNPDAELAQTVRREMSRLDAIVSRMLKFAAPAKPEFSSVRLHQILEHSLRLVQHRVGARSIAFHRQFHAASDALNGDDHQLEQVFVNLLLNAVEALGAQGSVTVSTEVIADENPRPLREIGGPAPLLRVKISDTGTGIAPEHLEAIFDPFFTTKSGGTGLGLAVTRRIIEEHNGTIRVQSQPGQGTTFVLLLPTGPEPPARGSRV